MRRRRVKMTSNFKTMYEKISNAIKEITDKRPSVGIILGSGLSDVAESIGGDRIRYSDIAGFPTPTVSGHKGELRVSDTVVTLSGRFHFYEGHSMDTVVLPVFLLNALGVKTLIVTNAAGGVNMNFSPGDIVCIKDHINLMGTNPLIGPNNDEFGPRFPDMSQCYSKKLMNLADEAAGKKLNRGVYAAFSGPSYETPAEIRMVRTMGADLVGMSTVPEVIVARYLSMEVAGFSCVTNMAAGILDTPLNHEEVLETGRRVKDTFSSTILSLLKLL
jgi:purine-nucleoside phosphorylase